MPFPSSTEIPSSSETGTLGICHLCRYLSRQAASIGPESPEEQQWDQLLLDALGVGLAQTLAHLHSRRPSLKEFENWVRQTTGGVLVERIERFNAVVRGEPIPETTRRRLEAIAAADDVLSAEDLAHWEEHGYVVLHRAVTEEALAAAEQLIWEAIGGSPDDVESWYGVAGRGAMTLEIYQHPALTAIREAPRIHKAFAQLWGTEDLWAATDRLGFNPPIRPDHVGSVQRLHWDVSLMRPIPFGTQGILYLTETPPEQGAFRLVPGFHRRMDAWLDGLPPGAVPDQQDLEALGPEPVAGRAGDLVIWNHQLPHGPSENHGERPRMVYYPNFCATNYRAQAEWF